MKVSKIIIILSVCCITQHTSAESRIISGKMVEIHTNAPIENGMVFLNRDSLFHDLRITDENGKFIFRAVELDSFFIKTMRYGYIDINAGPFGFHEKDTFQILIELEPDPIEMEPVMKIDERIDPDLERTGFYQRRETRTGYYYTQEEMKENAIHQISDLFFKVPGMHVKRNGFGQMISSIRYYAATLNQSEIPVNIYVDGTIVAQDMGPMGINFIHPENIKGIEVYPSSINAPAIYGGMFQPGGVILIWTKFQ